MRRSLPVLALVLLLSISASSQFNVNYNFSRPVAQQGKHIKQMHGLVFSYDFKLKNSSFYIAPEVGFNIYGMKTVEQELPFTNGYVTRTDVHYSSSVNSYAAVLRFMPETGKSFQPFLAIRGGALHYHSNLTVDDPEDPLGCRALEKKVLARDFTWLASGGLGFRLDGKVFSGRDSKVSLDFGAFYTHSGEVEYLKISSSHNHDHSTDPKSSMYYVKFEHIPSGEVHEHAIGTMHRTASQFLEFRLGIHVNLNN